MVEQYYDDDDGTLFSCDISESRERIQLLRNSGK